MTNLTASLHAEALYLYMYLHKIRVFDIACPMAQSGERLSVKAAVLWERPGCALAQSSPNSTWAAMGLRADSARRLSVRAEPLTRWGRTVSARIPIATNVRFGDDCANAQPGLSQWTAAFRLLSWPAVRARFEPRQALATCSRLGWSETGAAVVLMARLGQWAGQAVSDYLGNWVC